MNNKDLESVDKTIRKTPVNLENEKIEVVGTTFDLSDISAKVTIERKVRNFGQLELQSKNTTKGILENGDELNLIIDSGSSKTLISAATVSENPILSKIKKTKTPRMNLYVGDDGIISSDASIIIPMSISKYKFNIKFQIVDSLTKRFCILGDDYLSKINAVLHMGNKTMQFDIKTIYLSALDDYTINPGSVITIQLITDEYMCKPIAHEIPFSSYQQNLEILNNNCNSLDIKNTSNSNVYIRKGQIIARTDNNYVDVSVIDTTSLHSNLINSNHKDTVNDSQSDKVFKINGKEIAVLDSESNFDINECTNLPETENHCESDSTASNDIKIEIDQCELNLTVEQEKFLTTLDNGQRLRYLQRKDMYKWLDYNDKRLYQSLDEIINDKFQISNTLLSNADQNKLKEMIKQHSTAFSFWGEIGEFKRKIHLSFREHEPFAMRAYPIPPRDRDDVEKEVNKLLSLGIIEPADDVIDISPAFAVRKKNSGIRLIIDLRKLNSHSIKDSYKMIHFDLLLKYISDEDVNYISMLDITQAYFSAKVDEESRRYLGLAIGEKIYQLTGLAQGAKNSAAEFTRAIDRVLRKHPKFKRNIITYIDDLCIFTKTLEEHMEIINELFKILADEGIKLSLEKCEFATKEIVILGHHFLHTEKGIVIKPLKRESIPLQKLEYQRI